MSSAMRIKKPEGGWRKTKRNSLPLVIRGELRQSWLFGPRLVGLSPHRKRWFTATGRYSTIHNNHGCVDFI